MTFLVLVNAGLAAWTTGMVGALWYLTRSIDRLNGCSRELASDLVRATQAACDVVDRMERANIQPRSVSR